MAEIEDLFRDGEVDQDSRPSAPRAARTSARTARKRLNSAGFRATSSEHAFARFGQTRVEFSRVLLVFSPERFVVSTDLAAELTRAQHDQVSVHGIHLARSDLIEQATQRVVLPAEKAVLDLSHSRQQARCTRSARGIRTREESREASKKDSGALSLRKFATRSRPPWALRALPVVLDERRFCPGDNSDQ
jgi:hypothetical protein